MDPPLRKSSGILWNAELERVFFEEILYNPFLDLERQSTLHPILSPLTCSCYKKIREMPADPITVSLWGPLALRARNGGGGGG